MILSLQVVLQEVYNEQMACLIDMADLGDGKPARDRTQTYKYARPAMKLTAKEDAVTMATVSDYWTEELAPRKCWAAMEVPRRGVYLVHYVNRPAGDCHAVAAMLSHQGSRNWPPIVFCCLQEFE
jgi:hypothetical protein